MSSPAHPTPVSSPPSQETYERVFNLQRRVEPDRENHITSSFSVLDINDNNNTLALRSGGSGLEIYTSRRLKKHLLGKNTTAHSDPVYKRNMTCFSSSSLAGTGNNLDRNNLALSPTPQENYPLARNSITVLSDSRVKNQLPDNSSKNPSTSKPPSSIYSHSLLQPICKS